MRPMNSSKNKLKFSTYPKRTLSMHLDSDYLSCVFVFIYLFKDQRLLHCSCPMNSANKQINSIFCVNTNRKLFFLLFLVFSFQQNKQ